MASYFATRGLVELLSQDMASADLRILLVTAAPASKAGAANLNFVADVVANEVTVTGYGRVTLAGEAVTEDDTNDQAYLSSTDPGAFGDLATGETVVGGWLFRFNTNDASSPLIGFLDCPDTPTNGGSISGVLGTITGGAKALVRLTDATA